MLELKNITKVFQGPAAEIRAVDDVSLTVPDGKLVAVQGPSGCGKTTLLLVAGGLLAPTDGEVTVDGIDLYGLSPDRRAKLMTEKIGFIFQQFHLMPYLSVLENVMLSAVVKPFAGAEQRAVELINHLGLSDRADHVRAQLSMGEQQRTALARAAFHRPAVILGDEPTGNLDPDNSATVLRYLSEFSKHASGLIVTHDPLVAGYADRILNMNRGAITWTLKE